MVKDNGGLAFPQFMSDGQIADAFGCGGMTLRQWYAGMAMRGAADVVCQSLEEDNYECAVAEARSHALACVMVADALIAAEKGDPDVPA